MALLLPKPASAAECTNTWIGTSGAEWQVASNWSAESIPTETDVACIPSGQTTTVTGGVNSVALLQGEGRVTITSGSLALLSESEASNIGILHLSGGELRGPNELVVTSSMTADGGTMAGAGYTALGATATGTVVAPGGGGPGLRLTEARSFNVHGTLNVSGTGGRLNLIESAFLGVVNAGQVVVKGPEGQITATEAASITNANQLTVEGTSSRLTLEGSASFLNSEVTKLNAAEGGIIVKGSASLENAKSLTLEGTAGEVRAEGTTIENSGTLEIKALAGRIRGAEGAMFENSGTLTINAQGEGNGLVTGAGAQPKLINTGTVRKTANTGTTEIAFDIDNEGQVRAETGILALTGGGNSGHEALASWTATGTAQLAFSDSSFSLGESAFTGRISSLGSADVKAKKASGEKAELWVTESSFSLTGSGEESVLEKLVAVSGEVSLLSGVKLTVKAKLTQEAGTLSIGVGATLTTDEVLQTGGTLTTAAESHLATQELFRQTEGRVTFGNNSTASLYMLHFLSKAPEVGVNFKISEGATVTIPGTGVYMANGGTGAENPTLLVDSNGTFDILHTLKVGLGTLSVAADGLLSVREAQTEMGTLELLANSDASMEGYFQGNGVTKIGAGALLDVEEGFLTGGPLGSAYVTGPGTMRFRELGWVRGTMTGGGTTIVTESGYTLWTETVLLENRTLRSEGLYEMTGSSTLSMSDGAVLENLGEFDASSEKAAAGAEIEVAASSTSAPKIINDGIFKKAEGTGTTEVTVPFKSNGIIRQLSGTLKIKNRLGVPASERFGPRCTCGDPVETASGDLLESQIDIVVGGLGAGLNLVRNYSALTAATATSPGPFGYGWSSAFGEHLLVEEGGKSVTLVGGDGSTAPFTEIEAGVYEPPAWSESTLSGSPGSGYTLTDPDQTVLTFSGSGTLLAVTDRNGNETTLAYESGRLKSIADPAGRQIKLTYNGAGFVESAEDPMGHVITYAYEGGELTSVTLPESEQPRWQFDYDGSHRMTKMIDGRGGETKHEYDGASRVISQTDPAGRTHEFEYDGFHTRYTNKATGSVTDLWFNSNNEPTSITRGFGSADATTELFTYDAAGRQITHTDGNGNTTEYEYNAAGDRTRMVDALENESTWEYNSTHDVIAQTTPNGETTTIVRDAQGNPETISRPAPEEEEQVTTYEYDESGQLEALIDPLGNIWSYDYDPSGNLISQLDPEGNEWTWQHNENSEITAAVSPRGNEEGAEPGKYTTTYGRDDRGRLISLTDPLGHTSEYTYDGNDNLKTVTDQNSHITTYTYNAADEPIEVKEPNGDLSKAGYSGAGVMISQTDGNGQTTEYIRNVLGQPVETIDPLKRKTIRAYDDAGNLISKTDAEGRKTTYVYDIASRLEEITYSSGNPSSVEFTYDSNGNLLTMSDGTGTSSYEYDVLGRLIEAQDGHGSEVLYDYDLADRQTGITYPNGETVVNAFDKAGRLESVTDWLGNTTAFDYDRNSNLDQVTFPAATGNVDEFAYDRADEMTAVAMKKGSETLASLGYMREKLGQVESLTSKGLPGPESEAFTYDKNNRLTKAGSSSYAYDAADNLTKAPGMSFSYDAASQLAGGTGKTYTFDKLGERTKETRSLAPAFSLQFGSSGSGNGQLNGPSGIAVKGGVWVADTGNHRIQKFSESGAYVSQFGKLGTSKGRFNQPRALTVSAGGHVWVADTGNHRVQKLSESGEALLQFGKEGSSAGQFKSPSGIALSSSGHIWVADTGNNRIQEFNAEGSFVRQFGTTGSGNGQLKAPSGLAVAANGHIWVADKENNRIQEFSAEGAYLSQFGVTGSGEGQLKGPTGVALGSNGTVWVADTGNHRVQVFNSAGEYITQFGKEGSGSGQLKSPGALILGASGDIWIADTGNNRVQKWLDSSLITTYAYDQAGNLTSVQRPKVGETPVINETYAYDGMGRRVSQTVSGATKYLSWNTTIGLPLLLNDGEYSYIYGPDGLPVAQISSAGTPSYYHHDQLGSTRMLTGAGGSPTATFTYEAYGALAGSTGTQRAPLGYAGQYTNEQSALQYLRARIYDPASGQFLTQDPLGALTRMPYAYANDSPINWIDPSGQLGLSDIKDVALDVANELNPVRYYQEEIECWQDGTCSYWEAVGKGLQGACTFIPGGWGGRVGKGLAGRGIKSFADDAARSTGRTVARSQIERGAMKTAKTNPAAGRTIIDSLGDSRWPGSEGWVKKAQNINGVEIHYNYNVKTGKTADWKFK